MRTTLLLFTILFVAISITAQTTLIPDANFEQALDAFDKIVKSTMEIIK